MEYAEAMCQTPPAVTDEMSAALLEDLGADGLIELTARIGFMNLAARSNVALGIHLRALRRRLRAGAAGAGPRPAAAMP